MTVDPHRFEALVGSLEKTTLRLSDVAGELKLIADRQVYASGAIQELEHDLKEERRERLALEKKVDRWVNRGWGAWGVLVLAFTLVTAFDFKRPPEPPAIVTQQPERDIPQPPPAVGGK